jgi:hypothetical protein
MYVTINDGLIPMGGRSSFSNRLTIRGVYLMKRIQIITILTLFLLILFSVKSLANSNYRYEYDENNLLVKIYKDEISYMNFEYDDNGNLTKKIVLLPPPTNIRTEVSSNNHLKITWDPVPRASNYQIFYKEEGSNEVKEVANTENTFIEFNQLNINTTYSFVISSQGKNGYSGDVSNVIKVTIDKGNSIMSSIKGILSKGSSSIPSTTFSIHTLDGAKWYDSTSNSVGEFEFMLPDGQYQIDGVWVDLDSKWYELYQKFYVFNGQLIGDKLLKIDLENLVEKNVTGSLKKGMEPLANVTFSIRTLTGEIKWYDTRTDDLGNFALYLPNNSYKLEGIWVSNENKWYELKKNLK